MYKGRPTIRRSQIQISKQNLGCVYEIVNFYKTDSYYGDFVFRLLIYFIYLFLTLITSQGKSAVLEENVHYTHTHTDFFIFYLGVGGGGGNRRKTENTES